MVALRGNCPKVYLPWGSCTQGSYSRVSCPRSSCPIIGQVLIDLFILNTSVVQPTDLFLIEKSTTSEYPLTDLSQRLKSLLGQSILMVDIFFVLPAASQIFSAN